MQYLMPVHIQVHDYDCAFNYFEFSKKKKISTKKSLSADRVEQSRQTHRSACMHPEREHTERCYCIIC